MASLALTVVTLGIYIAMLIPATITVRLDDVARFSGLECAKKANHGEAQLRFLTMCEHLEEDELFVQGTMAEVDIVQFDCRNADGEAVNVRPVFTKMMADKHSALFFFLPVTKAVDTFLVVFFIKSALTILVSFGISGLALCSPLRLEQVKRQVIARSLWVYATPSIFLFIALTIYGYGYFFLQSEPSDYCMLDRRFAILEAIDTLPTLLITTAFLLFQVRAIRQTREAIHRDAFLFDPDRPFAWFRVMADKYYARARKYRPRAEPDAA